MPFPSLGCVTCKRRRVKCDETHPVCRQCAKGARECGYDEGISEDHSRKFKNENVFATGDRKRRPRKQKASVAALSLSGDTLLSRRANEASVSASHDADASDFRGTSASSLTRRDQANTTAADTLTWHLDLPLEAHALAHYAVKYTASPSNFPEIIDGHIKYVLPAFWAAPDDSPIKYTITACSQASLGIDQGNTAVLREADSAYQKALASTKQALLLPEQLISDELLVTVMALSHYEGMMHVSEDLLPKPSSGPGHGYRQQRSWSHHAGAVSLLQLRQAACLSEQQMALDRTVRRGLIKTFLLREQPIPPWLAQGASFGETGLGLAIDEATVRVSNLRHQASKVLQTTTMLFPPNKDDTRRLVSDAHAVEAFLCSVMEDLSSEWAYEMADTVASEDTYYGKKAYVYTSLGHAAIWNRYRALRLLVNDTILRAIKQLSLAGEQLAPMLEASAEAKIQNLLRDLCASVPQYFGHVVARPTHLDPADSGHSKAESDNALSINLLTFSLLIAVSISSISNGQKGWLKERLAEVGKRANKRALRAVAARA